MIFAVSEDGVIGKGNSLPWKLPRDLKYFKKMTLGDVVVMGRKTFESLPGRNGLKGRENIVITSQADVYNLKSTRTSKSAGVRFVSSLEELLTTSYLEKEPTLSQKRWWIIGGKSIYEQVLEMDIVDTIYRTVAHTTVSGEGSDCFGNGRKDLVYFDIPLPPRGEGESGTVDSLILLESNYYPKDDDNEFDVTFEVWGVPR